MVLEIIELLQTIGELASIDWDSLKNELDKEDYENLLAFYNEKANQEKNDLSASSERIKEYKNELRKNDNQNIVPSISKSGVKHVEKVPAPSKEDINKSIIEAYKKEKMRREAEQARLKKIRENGGTATISLSGVSYKSEQKKTVVKEENIKPVEESKIEEIS